jgi:hypothetical protein
MGDHSRAAVFIAIGAGLAAILGGVAFLIEAPSSEPTAKMLGDSSLVEWRAPTKVAAGPAYRGPWRMNDSHWDFVDDPTVALAGNGTVGVAWTDHAEQDLFFQRFPAEGAAQLGAPTNISRSPETFSWLPDVAFAGGDPRRVYVLWQEIIFSGGTHGGEAFFARSTDGGRTFAPPVNLSRSAAGDGKGRLTARRWDNGSLDLAVGPGGTVYAAWTEYEGRLWVRRSTDGGRQFDAAVHVGGSDARPARGPSLAVGPEAAVHLAWATGGSASADLRYARSSDRGRSFGNPDVLLKSGGHSDAPSLAASPDGTLHLVYAEGRSSSGRGYHLRYARRPPAADSFRAPTPVISGRSGSAESRHYPTLRVGPSGRLLVLWERFPSWGQRPQGLGLSLSRDGVSRAGSSRESFSRDGGPSFSAPALVPHSADAPGFNGSQQGLLAEKVSVGDRGGVAVVNSTFDRGEASAIWLYRGRLPGP